MSLEHEDLITSRVERRDVRRLIEQRFDGGSNVVYFEKAEGKHVIYISDFLEVILGGHESVGALLEDTFVDDSYEYKPEIFFSKFYSFFGSHKVLTCDICYPHPPPVLNGYPSVEYTETIFNRAVRRKIRS